MKTKVQVKDLREGDELSSGTKITASPIRTILTPIGKVELGVRYRKAAEDSIVEWGTYTTVTVVNR